MPITTSKIKSGTLTLGTPGTDFACQVTNVKVTPDHTTEEGVETLCGDSEPDQVTTKWKLVIEAIQDFHDADGFVRYAFANNGDEVAFTWEAGATTGDLTVTGTVVVQAVEMGGEVNKSLRTTAEWPIVGEPTLGAIAP